MYMYLSVVEEFPPVALWYIPSPLLTFTSHGLVSVLFCIFQNAIQMQSLDTAFLSTSFTWCLLTLCCLLLNGITPMISGLLPGFDHYE